MDGHKGHVKCCVFSKDGDLLATASLDTRAKVQHLNFINFIVGIQRTMNVLYNFLVCTHAYCDYTVYEAGDHEELSRLSSWPVSCNTKCVLISYNYIGVECLRRSV